MNPWGPGAGRLLQPAPGAVRSSGREGIAGWAAATAAGLALVVGGASGGWLAFAVAGGELAATISWLVARTLRERTARSNERQVIMACSMIAGQLDVGEIPAKAVGAVASDVTLLATAAGVVQVGGDVAGELRRLAGRPGCSGFDALARGWRLCERTGMPLGPVTRQVADDLRRQGDIRDQRRAELATARSTGRLLAGLPAVGVGMGYMVGTNPLHFLASSLAGHICLVAAATLACAGLIWTEHLAKEPS